MKTEEEKNQHKPTDNHDTRIRSLITNLNDPIILRSAETLLYRGKFMQTS